jgi:hypothetical protein
MKFAAFAVASLLAIVGSTTAATVTYSTSVPETTTNWGSINLNLPQWDPALFPGQSLTGVQLTLAGSVSGSAAAESQDNAPSTINLNVAATISANAPSGLFVQVIPLAHTTFSASAFDGSIDFGGTSGVLLTNLTNSAVSSSSLNNPPTDLSAYIGNGNISIATSATGSSSGSGSGNLITQFTAAAGVDVIVTYTFDVVPAPASAGLLGLAGLVAVRRRR